jgi:TetR/AcrR family transcriptional regulator, cholesterol catabolism regulator
MTDVRPPEPATLSAKQSERRRRVLDAAMALAEEGGYEAVQMRDVAARADVALGTVYRYFTSKDQMLAAVWADWTSALERRLHGQPLQGDTRAERVIDFLRRATRPLERRPKLAGALIKSWTSPDQHAAEYQREVASWMTRIVIDALDGLPMAERQAIREVLGHVWYSLLLGWVNGRFTIGRVHEVIESACRLMLDPREGT